MDPEKRSQLGAHYTSRADIEPLVEPVALQPLRREWQEVRRAVDNLLATGKKKPTGKEKPPSRAVLSRARQQASTMVLRATAPAAQPQLLRRRPGRRTTRGAQPKNRC
jgi:hypothetical protein